MFTGQNEKIRSRRADVRANAVNVVDFMPAIGLLAVMVVSFAAWYELIRFVV